MMERLRSRKYFPAIDCLSESELGVTDKITQWELYEAAQIAPIPSHLSWIPTRWLAPRDSTVSYRTNWNLSDKSSRQLEL